MWESELVAGQGLPPVCAITGRPATGWLDCEFGIDPARTDTDAPTFKGRLPVSARVLHADRAIAWFWGLSLLCWAAGVVFIVIGSQVSVALICGTMGAWVAGALIIAPVSSRVYPSPTGVVRGIVDGERWVLVLPVHQAFASATSELPRRRPESLSGVLEDGDQDDRGHLSQ